MTLAPEDDQFVVGLAEFTAAANTTSYSDTTVQPGQSYFYHVSASGNGGSSAASASAAVTAMLEAEVDPQISTAKQYGVEARYGGINTWELGLNINTSQPPQAQSDFAWTSGAIEPFTFSSSPDHVATFTIGSGSNQRTIQYDYDPALPVTDLILVAKAVNGTSSAEMSNLVLDGVAVDALLSVSTGGTTYQEVRPLGADLSDGWTLTGNMKLTWTSAPSSSGLEFMIKAVHELPTIDVDVNADGDLDDPVDGLASFSPGHVGDVAVLSPEGRQLVNLVIQHAQPYETLYVSLTDTSDWAGIASNADAVWSGASPGDPDCVLPDADPTGTVTVMADNAGKAMVPMLVADFAATTRAVVKVPVSNGTIEVANADVPKDSDKDGLPDWWEGKYGGNLNGNSDEDKNTGANPPAQKLGDRLSAFDEYRGFMKINPANAAQDVHVRTSPVTKDVFVYSPDNDPYLAQQNNDDGFQSHPANGQPIGSGAVASQAPVAIHMLRDTQFWNQGQEPDGNNNSPKGDVNFNSPAPVGGVKQKRIWITTDLSMNPWTAYGKRLYAENQIGPNATIAWSPTGNNPAAASWVYLSMIRSDLALVDNDGAQTAGPGASVVIFGRHQGDAFDPPAGFPPIDGNYEARDATTIYMVCPFRAQDKVVWWDRDNSQHWSRGDALWRSAAGNNQFNAQNDQVIVGTADPQNGNLAQIPNGQQGVILGPNTEFRYVTDINNPGYQLGWGIFTTHFNRAAYIAARDANIAHEGLGHPLEMQHPAEADVNRGLDIMVDQVQFTAGGMFMTIPNPPGRRWLDFPIDFSAINKDRTQLL